MLFSETTFQQVERIAALPYSEFKDELAAFGFKQLSDDLSDCDACCDKHHLTPFVNALLVTRYPFLLPRSVWDDNDLWDGNDAYTYTLFGGIPDGWCYRFGLDLCEDVRTILLTSSDKEALTKYRVVQIKEKFAGLRWYDEFVAEDVYHNMFMLTYMYELLSYHVCITCGSMNNMHFTRGYVLPLCEDCLMRTEYQHFDRDKFVKWYAEQNNLDVDSVKFWSIPFEARDEYMRLCIADTTRACKDTFMDALSSYTFDGKPFDCASWARDLNLQITRFFI